MKGGIAFAGLGLLASAVAEDLLPEPKCEFSVEMVYLQDFSQSYDDDKVVSKAQLKAVFNSVASRYPDSKFAMGSYVDKPLLNFGYPPQGDWFEGDWCLKVSHQFGHGDDIETMVEDYFAQEDGGGNDFPENQLGALHEIAAGDDIAGWTDAEYTPGGVPIVRLVVMATNSIYHVAGDAAGAPHFLPPNNGIVEDGDCEGEDYPSIEQVENALFARKVKPVFLVGNKFPDEMIREAYEELGSLMPKVNTAVHEVEDGDEGLLEAFRLLFDQLEDEICTQTLDVVFAQDVTSSYFNDMPMFRDGMGSLMESIETKFPDSCFGMTTFGDKPLFPLGHQGSGDYCYRVESPLTVDRNAVETAANMVVTTSGVDWRESQLDALISSATDPALGWRAGDHWQGRALLRVVVLATDAGYHRAPDALNAGFELIAHDGGVMTDARCTSVEYPTFEVMAQSVKDAGAYLVFVPTSDIAFIYRNLQERLLNEFEVESEVVELQDFHGDLVAGVQDALEKIASRAGSRVQ